MTTARICKALIKANGTTQRKMAEKLGMTECAFCNKLRRGRIHADLFLEILEALDYDVKIVKKGSGCETALADIAKIVG